MKNQINPLLSVSPIDGRYRNKTENISEHFSEFAYLKFRIEIEIRYLIKLSKIGIIRKINSKERKILENVIELFDVNEGEKIKNIENKTHHDVKAIEYYIREKLKQSSLSDISEYIHFGLTSEDINNIALRLMLKSSLEKIILPSIIQLNSEILDQSKKYSSLPMLARTHGQPAVPTTLGKELNVFRKRLNVEIKILKEINFGAKLNGAVGNYNALYFAYPKTDWHKFSIDFISDFNLESNSFTTQIAPYEDIIYFFQTIQRINGIIMDFDQDMWRYISDNWFTQINKDGEIGSSTMPQKINPILFENSEGNLIIANSLIDGFINKLPLSRLQRDLTGSTISRNFGVALAHSLIAYKNAFEGLERIKPNEKKIKKDLNEDWSILSEAIQIYLKKEGIKNSYELLKDLTRGEKINEDEFKKLIDNLPLNNNQKIELYKLTPENYLGLFNI